MLGDQDGPTRVAQACRLIPIPTIDHAIQQTRGEGVASSQDITHLGGKKGRAAAGFLAQPCATDQESTAPGNRGCQYIVDGEFDISAVIAVVGERKAIWWLDAQHHGTRTTSCFARNKTRLDTLLL